MKATLGLYPSGARGGVLVVLLFFAGVAALGAAIRDACGDLPARAAGGYLLWAGVPMVLAIAYVCTRRVTAGPEGVRLLGAVRRRSLRWNEIVGATVVPGRRGARIELHDGRSGLSVPAAPLLAQVIRTHAPHLAPALSAIPDPASDRRRLAAQGLERWLIAIVVAGSAVLISTFLAGVERRVIAGVFVATLGAIWMYGTRERAMLVPAFSASAQPGWLLGALAGMGESAAAGVLLLLALNAAIGVMGVLTLGADAPEMQRVIAEPRAVRTWVLGGRELDLPERWSERCSEDDGSLVCATPHGWIAVRRDESDAGLLGGDVLREAVAFRRDDLRMDGLPHHALRWYVGGRMSSFLKTPTAVVIRDDGTAGVYWRSPRGVQAMLATGGEMLTVDLKGDAAREEALHDVLSSTRARGSDLLCRYASALGRLGGRGAP